MTRHRKALRSVYSSAKQGFTILEIMIATAILTLGLVGILALFPVAIQMGKDVVETSTSVVIAESVADSIREGMRNRLRYTVRGGVTHTYFVFKHDGVEDRIPARTRDEKPQGDYYILLPRYRLGAKFPSREQAIKSGKTFVYPETDSLANGNGDAFTADDDGDDRKRFVGAQVFEDIRVDKTYQIGQFLPADDAPDGPDVLDDQKIEALKQYSFAFSIQPSYADVNMSQSKSIIEPGNRLYHVRVMVFRGFLPPGPDADPPEPDFELDFEVST